MDLILRKGGYISTKKWEYDETTEKGEYIYDFISVRDNNIFNYLQSTVELEKGFTLRDLFKLVDNYEILQLLDSFWPSFVKEYKECPYENCLSEEFDYLRIRKIVEKTKFKKKSFDECLVWTNFDAKSKEGDIDYSVSFCKLSELIDHEFRLGKLVISEDDHNMSTEEIKLYYENHIPEEWDTNYTLYEVLHCVIYELSFYGTPKNREETGNELKEVSKSIEDGTANLVEFNLDDFGRDEDEDGD